MARETTASVMAEAVTQFEPLAGHQEEAIHAAVCEVLAGAASGDSRPLRDADLAGSGKRPVMGAFVTLKRAGRLRACCGALGETTPLADALAEAAHRTARHDPRVPPISPTELPYLDVRVTLLFNFQPLAAQAAARRQAVIVGRHGLQIRRGEAAGLLLPTVAAENGLDVEQFLQLVCQKAELPATAWEDEETKLSTFEGYSFGGPFTANGEVSYTVPPPVPHQRLQSLAQQCRRRALALLEGTVPDEQIDGCEREVAGAVLSVYRPNGKLISHWSQLSPRTGASLQITLNQLCESVAGWFHRQGMGVASTMEFRFELSLLYDPAMHGPAKKPDVRGIEPQSRAVLVTEDDRSAWVYSPGRSPETLVARAIKEAQVASLRGATVYSLAIQSTSQSVSVSNVPRRSEGAKVRPPAVAGVFYPDDGQQLDDLVNQMLQSAGAYRPEPWSAIMVPHAGLRYSGRIAAQTFARVRIPQHVVVIGPKHTRSGVNWAVAPHQQWELPTGRIDSDPQWAAELVRQVPGLEPDAAAHQDEHGIEVELPFIAKLAPQARVVGIVVGSGDWSRCQRFASGLAEVIRKMAQPPLLVISSDMNHYARDDENRRLDDTAMQALETLEPRRALQTIQGQNITMCGVLPAVIVLETLRKLKKLHRAQRVAYGTSADVSGDPSRVVGYAGMLFG